MIWVVTMWDYDKNTHVDCVKATYKKAREYIEIKNREQSMWFYQIWEREIE